MATVDGDIETLSRAILGEARVESEGVEAQAREKAQAIRQRAKTEADQERTSILEEARQEADRLRSQALATAQLKARTLELEHREKLLLQVFETAAKRLPTLLERKDYPTTSVRLLREALTQLKTSSADIRADGSTQKVLTPSVLEEISNELGVRLSLGKTLEHGTGLIVQATDGHLQVDSTLETRLARLHSNLRSAVYHLLMGERP